MCSGCNSRRVQGDVFQNLDESRFSPHQTDAGVVGIYSNLSGQLVYSTVLVKQLQVEVPYHRFEVFVSFGTEEADPSVFPLHLKQEILSVRMLRNSESRKVVLKVHRKPFVRFVYEQIIGNRLFLIQ